MTAEPFMRVLSDYRLSETQKMHWQRVLRGLMHALFPKSRPDILRTTLFPWMKAIRSRSAAHDRWTAPGRRRNRCPLKGLRCFPMFRSESGPDAGRSYGHQPAYHGRLQHGGYVLYRTAQRSTASRGDNARYAVLHVPTAFAQPVRTGRLQPDFRCLEVRTSAKKARHRPRSASGRELQSRFSTASAHSCRSEPVLSRSRRKGETWTISGSMFSGRSESELSPR